MYNHHAEPNFKKFSNLEEDTPNIWNHHYHYQVNQGQLVMKTVNQSQSCIGIQSQSVEIQRQST